MDAINTLASEKPALKEYSVLVMADLRVKGWFTVVISEKDLEDVYTKSRCQENIDIYGHELDHKQHQAHIHHVRNKIQAHSLALATTSHSTSPSSTTSINGATQAANKLTKS